MIEIYAIRAAGCHVHNPSQAPFLPAFDDGFKLGLGFFGIPE